MSRISQKIIKYGKEWPDRMSALEVEFAGIRMGDEWLRSRGSSLFQAYKDTQIALWPDEDHNRWSDLILKEILQNDITAVVGPKDSGKTRGMAKYALVDYFCFPKNTLFIISSTTLQSLETRVWGDIKSLYRRAKERWPKLPGHVVDSKHAICTDNINDESVLVRDMRKGILCFLEDSLVDTPIGPIKIQNLKVGDEVFNAIGIGTIKETFNRTADKLVRIHLSDKRTIDCTPEHPIFTRRGWIKAIDLKAYDVVFSADETLSLMQSGISRRLSQSQVLLERMPPVWGAKKMQPLWKYIPALESKKGQDSYRQILQHGLRFKMVCGISDQKKDDSKEVCVVQKKVSRLLQSNLLLGKMPTSHPDKRMSGMWKAVPIPTTVTNPLPNEILRGILQAEIEQSDNWRETPDRNQRRTDSSWAIPKFQDSLSSSNGVKNQTDQTAPLRNRHRFSSPEIGRGNRWKPSFDTGQEETRPKTNQSAKQAWVARIEVLDQGSDPRFNEGKGGYSVYNLEVSGHPSYYVSRCLAHNCVPCKTSAGQTNMTTYVGIKQERKRYIGDEMQFMANSMYESLANAIGPNFKMVCAGNPIGDGDPLDIITEPKGGWGTLPEPEKTVTWDNQRFINSRTVNLVGTDSPNFDYPESEPTKYWYLISRDSIARTVAGYGKDSHQYYSQCKGVRRVGLNSRRVITMELCREHNAMSDCTWRGDPMMKVFALDAAYGGIGGDRCIGGHVEFGMCEDGKVRLSVGPPQLVPVRLSRDESPEDQIATWTKEYCESNDVLPENAFYDSTGRGALGISFARVWSNKINPVEFGGSPSMRPVSNDFFITDFRTKEKRLKRCDEHYRKFVTELWWTVRLIIESDQMRNLSEDVAQEGCKREWKEVAGNKIEIETKHEMRDRMGRSPDLFDWLACACEGARRRGLLISKFNTGEAANEQDDWLAKEAGEYSKFLKTHRLKEYA